jgi:malonyl-CoA O-methyltransferase
MNTELPNQLDKQHIRRSFDRAAENYEQWASGLQKDIGESLVQRVQCLTLEPKRILDVGAGTGRMSRALMGIYNNAEVYSLDIAFKMLRYARKKNLAISEHRFICADAAALPFANNSMDLIISNLMLQWCENIHQVFQEFARILTPDGIVLFSTLGTDTLKELRQSWAYIDDSKHVNSFLDMHNVGDALLSSGLRNVVTDAEWHEYVYDTVQHLMREIKAVGAHNVSKNRFQGLTGKKKFETMLATYENYRSPDGLLPATYEVIYGYASGKQKIIEQKQYIKITPIDVV